MSVIKAIPVKELDRLLSVGPTAQERGVNFETYVIPDYQRGYRWEADIHVEALLNDILAFSKMPRKNTDRYCLQPVVVAPSNFKKGAWEVIDGQQRLTTLYLILHALDPHNSFSHPFELTFESRIKSDEFIRDLVKNNIEDHTDPDFHFMSEAWKKINAWLDEQKAKDNDFLSSYMYVLRNEVNIIWYNTESSDRNANIDVFNRLNIGKIPLTNAELVKALILTKLKGLYQDEELSLRLSEINNDWHRIENELRKPSKWGFLDSPLAKNLENHIELIFRLLAEKEAKGQFGTYLYFEKKIISDGADFIQQAHNAIAVWKEIKEAFARINSWFCDVSVDTSTTIYHYVGYLLASGQMKIQALFSLSEGKGRSAFSESLKRKIQEAIKDIDPASIDYKTEPEEVKRILLLFNVLTCEGIARGPYNRFPFDRYNAIDKKEKWSLEHINAQRSKDPLKKKEAMRKWVEETWHSVKDIDFIKKTVIGEDGEETIENRNITAEKAQLQALYDLPEESLQAEAVDRIRDIFNKIFDDGDIKHALGNMALLSKPDNSALNNSIFPVKRDHIISLEKQGRFIPPCTRNVFLKFYSTADTQPYYWSRHDQTQYFENICSIINKFKES